MHMGKASAYAVFASLYIAERGQAKPVQGREIAKERGIPFGYLLKILQQLVRSDVLSSQVGRSGGFTLKRNPDETTILQIIEAVEGPLRGSVAIHDGEQISDQAVRLLANTCDCVAAMTRAELGKITLDSLMHPAH